MQSPAAVRSLRLLPAARTCLLPLSRASTTPFKPGDPAVHSEDPQGEDADEAAKSAAAEAEQRTHPRQQPDRVRTDDPTSPVKSPPFASSPSLKSAAAVGPTTVEPNFQQKRHLSRAAPSLDDVACVGPDGSPLDRRRQKDEESVAGGGGGDDDEYYREHKASPLSEVEFADTRLPISRARDGEKRDDLWGGGRGGGTSSRTRSTTRCGGPSRFSGRTGRGATRACRTPGL